MKKSLSIIFLVLICDQALKFWVKTHMFLGQQIPVFDNWFYLSFTENIGMAFGLKFAGSYGKLILSVFRLLAITAIGWYLVKIIKNKAKTGLIICVSLIFAGAIGNILDSLFYGMIFSNSGYDPFYIAKLFPSNGGYSSFLHGKVVDMLYFPIIKGTFPDWFPFWKSQSFIFFRPIFNIADSAISVGVFALVLFQKKLFKK